MNDKMHGGFEYRLRAMLVDRAASVSAPGEAAGLSAVAIRARQRQNRRRWGAGALASVMVMSVGIGIGVASTGGSQGQAAGSSTGRHHLDRRNGVLVLPLSGSVTAAGPLAKGRGGAGAAVSLPLDRAQAGSGATSGPIDVSPTPSSSLERLFAHTSPDGVQITAFEQPAGGSGSAPVQDGGGPSIPGALAQSGCLTTTQLTIEISDMAAVGTFSEPLFDGANGALVDVQVGEIGSVEGAPATWVLAQVGAGATTVEVHFADGSIDQAPVPSSGIAALGHKGAATSALGTGSLASISVLGSDGQVLASYGLGADTSPSRAGTAPTTLPAPGPIQPADLGAATTAVTRAIETALGCDASPLQRSQAVAGGGPLEAIPTLSASGVVNVERVVFSSATSAVVQYQLHSAQRIGGTGPLYAAATLTGNGWQPSLASVAPGIQVTPANQVGNVTIAPGGPLLTRSWPGGTAVAVYEALPGSGGGSGYGTGDAVCTPAGGIVEEITTPGAVGVLTAPLFPDYATPLIGAAVSTVGSAEGAPATVVGVEVGSQVTTLAVTGTTGTVEEAPVNGAAVIVLVGDPSAALGAASSKLEVSDRANTVLATVPLQVDTAPPLGPSSLPTSLPAPGQGPSDPQTATQAINQAFAAVFDCSTPPIARVEYIQDGSLVAGALEQLDTGPYEALASSSYLDVNRVVFVNPVLADVSYTIRFHSDTQLTFSMIGQAVVVDSGWRVSYATVCAAIQLGLGTCQT